MRIIILIFVLFFISGCTSKLIDESTEQIDFDTSRKHAQQMTIDSIISAIDIVRLESNEECLMDRCKKLIVHGDKFYIRDQHQHVVNIFNERGDFITSTKSSKGEGPNEYFSLTDFIISNDVGDIEFLDPRQFKIFKYSINGKIEKQIKLNPGILPLSKFFKLNNDEYLFYSGDGYKDKKHVILYSISKEKIVNSFLDVNDQSTKMGISTTCPFSYLNGDVLINHLYPSNITYRFNIEKRQVVSKRILNIDQNTFKIDDLPSGLKEDELRRFFPDKRDQIKFVLGKIENSRYLIVTYYDNDDLNTIFYDKKLADYFIYTSKPRMLNQIPLMNYCDEDYLYYICEPMYLKYYVNTSLMTPGSIDLMNKVDVNDNPVIIKYKLKK